MCDLCGTEEEQLRGRQSALDFSERLLWLSQCYRSLSNGTIDPHGEKSKEVAILAKAIIRKLVDEWV